MPGQNRRSRAGRRQNGAAAVEFGLIVIPLLTILFGIIQYGMYLWAWQAGADAARMAARRSAVAPACTDINGYARDHAGTGVGVWGSAERSITKAEGNTESARTEVGDVVTIEVTFDAIDLHLPLLPYDPQVHQQADARVEYVPAVTEPCA